jgi:hypothetical protein
MIVTGLKRSRRLIGSLLEQEEGEGIVSGPTVLLLLQRQMVFVLSEDLRPLM